MSKVLSCLHAPSLTGCFIFYAKQEVASRDPKNDMLTTESILNFIRDTSRPIRNEVTQFRARFQKSSISDFEGLSMRQYSGHNCKGIAERPEKNLF